MNWTHYLLCVIAIILFIGLMNIECFLTQILKELRRKEEK
jgi:hypothetical protein